MSPPRPLLALAIVVLLFCAACVAPAVLSDYSTQIGFRLLIYITLAEAWNLLAGYGGLVSLGSSSFVGIGGYVLAGLVNHAPLPLPLMLVAAGLAAAAMAVLVSRAVFRLRGLYFTVGTLALGEALRLLMVNVSTFGGAGGIFLDGDPPPTPILYFYALGIFAVATLVMTVYTRSRFSVILRSVRDDEDAAAQLGVRAFRVKLAVFAVASFLMGAAGGLQAQKLGAIEPYGMFGLQWSIDVLAIVIIGGAGQRLGPIVGAIFVIALGELLADYPEIHIALTGVILIVLVRFAPKGLCGLAVQVFDRLRAARVRPVGPLALGERRDA